MAVPFNQLQSEAIDNYGSKDAYDNLARFTGLIWWLGQKGHIKFEEGGSPNFRERLLYGLNTNIAFRGKGQSIPQNQDSKYTMVSVPYKLVDGAINYNQQDIDAVRGNSALAISLIDDETKAFANSWVLNVHNALVQGTPGANDPLTLLPASGQGANGILEAAAPASQTATLGGIPRSETVSLPDGTLLRWWANQYSNTSFDLTSTAGRRGLYLNVYSPCVRGNGAGWEPDFGLCADTVIASLSATADGNRRYTADEKALNHGFENIRFHNATLFIDRSDRFDNGSAGKVAFLNSRGLVLKVLMGAGGVQKEMLDSRNNLKSVPIFWKHKEMSDFATLNYNWVGYCTMNLVPKSLQDHGLADNCT